MSKIHSVSPKNPEKVPTPSLQSSAEPTAAKVSALPIPVIPRGLNRREAILLQDVKKLYKYVVSQKFALDPSEVDMRIEDLEEKMSLFHEATPEVKKMMKKVSDLRFFEAVPSAEEVYPRKSTHTMPDTFATTVRKIRNQVLKMHSVLPFKEGLNERQQREISHFMIGG